MKSGSSTRVERDEFFSQLLLHYRLTILESLNVYGINVVICKCEGNKQPINQNNVYERNNYSIASDRELTTKGGVHDLLLNAVLTDDSHSHIDKAT